MLESTLKKFGDIHEKHAVLILASVLIVTGFFFYYAVDLGTDASFDTMFGKDSTHYQLQELVSAEFGSTDQLWVLVELNVDSQDENQIIDIRDPRVLEAIATLDKNLERESFVANVLSFTDFMDQNFGRMPATLEESKEWISMMDGVIGRGINKDYTSAVLIIDVDIANKPGSLERIQDALIQRIGESPMPVGVKATLTGFPRLLNRIMNLLISDNLLTVSMALLAILIVLSFYFRSKSLGFLAIVPVVVALIWLAGTMALLDIRITMMTAAVGTMLVGMGVDYSVHMAHGFHDLVRKGRKNPTQSNLSHVGSALFISALTTTAGFIAMMFGVSASSKIQGLVLALGIVYAFIATVTALPSLLVVHRRLQYSDLDSVFFKLNVYEREEKENASQVWLSKLSFVQTKVPWLVLGAYVTIIILIIPGMGLLRMDTDNDNWIPENDDVFESLNGVSYNFGGLETQNYLVMLNEDTADVKDLRDPRVLRKIEQIEALLEDLTHINYVDSPVDTIKQQNLGKVPSEIERVKDIVADSDQIQSGFNQDYSIMKITAYSDNLGLGATPEDNFYEAQYEIESVKLPSGVSIIPQDGVASDIELNKIISQDSVKTTVLGFIFIFMIASLFYSSVVVGSLAIIPVIMSMVLTVGIMGYIDLPFTVLTTGMLAIVMGMGVDFSIHIIHATKSLLKRGKSIQNAVSQALTTTGEAILVSTLTTVLGFSALTFASLLATQRLGYTLAIAVAMCFITCIVIVPVVLTIEHNLTSKKTSGE